MPTLEFDFRTVLVQGKKIRTSETMNNAEVYCYAHCFQLFIRVTSALDCHSSRPLVI